MLSAIIGGNARFVFSELPYRFITTENVWGEVQEYLPKLAAKKKLSLSLLETAANLLPIELIAASTYSTYIAEAFALIGDRDPDDVPLLALAISLACPVWSNDNDFLALRPGIVVQTTAELLSRR